jgi:anti-sigma factor (TIGR02949 family)
MMLESMGMIRCEEALMRLWEFLDGALPAEEGAAVKKHLDICHRCFPKYDFQRAYFEYMRRMREHEIAPDRLRRLLFQRILREEAGRDP